MGLSLSSEVPKYTILPVYMNMMNIHRFTTNILLYLCNKVVA